MLESRYFGPKGTKMNRLLACTSVLALCAAFAQPADAGDTKPVAPTATSMPETLNGEIQRAKDLREKGQFAEASKALRQLMLVAGTDPRVASEYGKVLTQQGYAKDAVSILTKAVQLNGTDWTLYSALGVAYDESGDADKASGAYQQALVLKPEEPSVLSNFALSRLMAADAKAAVALAARAEHAGGGSDSKIARNLAMIESLAGKAK